MATAELLQRRLDLLLLDIVVLLVLRAARQALPGELTLDEVEKHVTDRFKIISSRLLNAFVCGNRCISSRSSEIFSIFVRNMFSFTILIALGKSEIDDIDVVTASLSSTNQEVVRFDVSVDDPLLVHLFDSFDELDGDHEHSLEIKVALA